MKKGFIIATISLLFLTGCSKKITCIQELDIDTVSMAQKVVLEYNSKDKVLNKLTKITKMTLKDKDYEDEFQDLGEDIKIKYNY